MTKFHSHYESLNVTRDAPAEVIRAAYRSLSQKHHPDKNHGNHHAAEMMARLNTAYSVLSDSEQREQYDLQILSEQRAREQNYAFQDSANDGNANVGHSSHTESKPGRNGQAASGTRNDKPRSGADDLLGHISHFAKGRDVRIAAMLLAGITVVMIPVSWFAWKENQSMLRLEQAAVYPTSTAAVPDQGQLAAAQAPSDAQVAGNAAKAKRAGTGAVQAATPSNAEAASAEQSKAAAAPKASAASSAAPKVSEFERLSAMLKSMGLGLHKLDLPTAASNAKQPPSPAKVAEPARVAESTKAAEPAKASSAPSAPTAKAVASAETPRAREETERVAPEPARNEAKAPADAGRASTASATASNTASAGHAPRPAGFADARDCATPAYPPNSFRNAETGTVQLALLVGSDGKVIESKLQKSSGFSDLDKAARRALSQCKFKPAPQADPTWTVLSYVWSLE